MAAKNKKNDATEGGGSLSFEQAMVELESIVEVMEYEKLPLEELVSRYEKGAELLEHCESVLKNAKKRIELITLKHQEAQKKEFAADGKSDTRGEDAQYLL